MVNWISNWAKGIALAVIISTIIEMILPENNNKKYIKMVIGVYILFAILSPIITVIKNKEYEFNIQDYQKYFENTYQVSSNKISENNDQNIEEIYKNNIEKDIIQKINNKGYEVNEISIDIQTTEENYGNINKIVLKIEKEKLDKINSISVNKVEINKSDNENSIENNNLDKSEIKEIKQYLSDTYNIAQNNIKIN